MKSIAVQYNSSFVVLESLCSKRELARERAQREHLKYLKEHDTEKYLELVKQSKDARIKTLLSQTDRFLASVRHKMIMQKSTTLEARKEQRISFQRWREQIDKGKDSKLYDSRHLCSGVVCKFNRLSFAYVSF